jgi:hypothetical protein
LLQTKVQFSLIDKKLNLDAPTATMKTTHQSVLTRWRIKIFLCLIKNFEQLPVGLVFLLPGAFVDFCAGQ